MKVFIFGLGFSARAAVRALRETCGADLDIAGTSRSLDRAHALGLERIEVHGFDGTAPCESLRAPLARASHVIASAPPGEGGAPVLRFHADDLMASDRLEWLCYFSTVGVYGDHGGAWIDETAELRPLNLRSRWRVAAEQAWRDFAAKRRVPLTILRLAGIYGPGRSGLDKLEAGTARRIVKKGQVFNRIHVEDIARVTALAARARLSGTFNLADDEPAPPQEVVSYAAGLIGRSPPPEVDFEIAEMTPMARSFYSDNKRVANAAIKKALGIELLYPTYRHGLTAIYEGL
ncbi:MAG: SDR family oxidoreductase [Alphaproteobacteria bacterium]|nr:SDR family oxidoreductase [Alphaproteobacteria bacterium]